MIIEKDYIYIVHCSALWHDIDKRGEYFNTIETKQVDGMIFASRIKDTGGVSVNWILGYEFNYMLYEFKKVGLKKDHPEYYL